VGASTEAKEETAERQAGGECADEQRKYLLMRGDTGGEKVVTANFHTVRGGRIHRRQRGRGGEWGSGWVSE